MFSLLEFKLKTLFFATNIFILVFLVLVQLYYSISREKQYPILIWWTHFGTSENYISCFNNEYTCFVTRNKNIFDNQNVQAIIFYGTHFEPTEIPKIKSDKFWALYHEESPRNVAIFLDDRAVSLFNFTSTFSRYSDMPLTFQYLENLEIITDSGFYIPLQEKQTENVAPIVYLQSDCDTPSDRDTYIQELMKYIDIDSYGTCLKNTKLPDRLLQIEALDFYNDEILKHLAKYKFMIAFENAICDDYITEKLWKPLIIGSVPIYLGSPTIEDWLPNNNSAILVKNFDNPKHLADFIKIVNSNDSMYESYLEHKIKKKISNVNLLEAFEKGRYGIKTEKENTVEAFECYVCKNLMETKLKIKPRSVYDCSVPHNSWKSHWEIGKCQSKALRYFLNKNITFTKEMFDNKWMFYWSNKSCV